MLAAYAARIDPQHPLDALEVGEIDVAATPGGAQTSDDWVEVQVRAAALNHHDLFSLRGVGLSAASLPMVLGCDAAGIAPDGSEVIVHGVINDPGFAGPDSTFDPRRSLLSERCPGTLAERVRVPRTNLVAKPAELTFSEAACLPTAWLTAYRMLFVQSGLRPGQTVLIQGAGGGVATALVLLARHAGLRVWVTSRSEERGERAASLGAHAWFPSGSRLPERVDAVMESVGAATWSHSINALRPGGAVVICGTTTGAEPERAELTKIFFKPLRVIGSTMGTRDELADLVGLLVATGLRPVIDSTTPLAEVGQAFERLESGSGFGKLVVSVG
ncbi:Zn-dependent oxidoreductase [Microlunatus endophyticus]|uniref:Zn-dependent oxidoreductase n=1 Tax=Microlunatus endophyticus TaxID=1716077 RepID=A0A917W2L0_9ACTN|nr:zinc-binding dehydrogenase [Microlunatus endophyticus]GGL55776.1 Zn-dependent oxidoreductase [Microlunatus endophyticus]